MIPFLVIGFLAYKGFNSSHKQKDLFTLADQERMLSKYRDQLGLGENFDYSAGAFDSYMDSRNKSVHNLETVFKDPKLQKAIEKSDSLRDQIQKALEPNPGKEGKGSLAEAAADYEETAKVFGELLKKNPPFKAQQIYQTMKNLADEGVKAIKAEHKYEIDTLTKLLDSEPFKTSLNAQGITDSEGTKKTMLKELEATHVAQEKAFTDSTQASLKTLQNASTIEMNRLVFLATLSDNSEKMRQTIKEAAAKKDEENKNTPNYKPSPLLGITGGKASANDPNIGVIKLTDLDTFYTQTGKQFTRKIEKEKDKDKEIFTMEFGIKKFADLADLTYYLLGDKVESDMTTLARAVKAGGHEYLEIDIDFKNQDTAMQRTKQAYNAGVEAGFDPDKIKIRINGEVKAAKDLFASNPSIITFAKQRAKELEKESKLASPINDEAVPNEEEIKSIKETMQQLRANAKKSETEIVEADTEATDTPTPAASH